MHYFFLFIVALPTFIYSMEQGFKNLTLKDEEDILVIVNKTSKPIKQQTNCTARQKPKDKGGLQFCVDSILGTDKYEVIPTTINVNWADKKNNHHARASIWHQPVTLFVSAIELPEWLEDNNDKELSLPVSAATEFTIKEQGFHGIYEENGKLIIKKLESCMPEASYKEQLVLKNESEKIAWYRIAALYRPKNKSDKRKVPQFCSTCELFMNAGKTFNVPKNITSTYTNNDDGRQFSREEFLSKVIVLRRYISNANKHSQKNSEPYQLTASTVSNQSYEFDNIKDTNSK